MDLTPYYPFEEDARHFHRTCHDAWRRLVPTNTRASRPGATSTSSSSTGAKRAAVGGIFYDDFTEGGFERGFA
jgi:coproporphyrinogen III oxidase